METLLMATFWSKILRLFGEASNILQKPGLDLLFGENILKGLSRSVSCFRDQFDLFEEEVKSLLPQEEYEYSMGRSKRQKKYPDVIVDKLVNELERRCNAQLFGLNSKLSSNVCLSKSEVEEFSAKVISVYADDLKINLTDELVFFSELLKTSSEKICNPLDLLRYILEYQLIDMFPNITFENLSIDTNSKLATMQKERLSSLTLMCIERDVLKDLEFNDVIEDFVKLKL